MIKKILLLSVVLFVAMGLTSCVDYKKGQCVGYKENVWVDVNGIEGCMGRYEVKQFLDDLEQESEESDWDG